MYPYGVNLCQFQLKLISGVTLHGENRVQQDQGQQGEVAGMTMTGTGKCQ
jgi:hypothetical protein